MIKLHHLAVTSPSELELTFSDGSHGLWSAAALIARDTVLTKPLADPAYFARAFIEAGSLAWPNGLELAGWNLHRELADNGRLVAMRAA
ncbi:DUF2442 domain-containing protein [Novosphingobium sp. B 225]|uniref:DUF2442 domain-containing protein n=1 Tax=Novosphingobium sp. B 225 TaxID=1961849 RepID=UPI000B4B2162|nr:DUF2442 domain-containing protein [Novosphingobium sp. B 225]